MKVEIILPNEAAAEALAKFELGVMLGLVGDEMNRAMKDRRLSGTLQISGHDVAEWRAGHHRLTVDARPSEQASPQLTSR